MGSCMIYCVVKVYTSWVFWRLRLYFFFDRVFLIYERSTVLHRLAVLQKPIYYFSIASFLLLTKQTSGLRPIRRQNVPVGAILTFNRHFEIHWLFLLLRLHFFHVHPTLWRETAFLFTFVAYCFWLIGNLLRLLHHHQVQDLDLLA